MPNVNFALLGYDFKLTSLLIVDEYGEGFPVAWCLSNREDIGVLKIFCENVKTNTGDLSPQWFMSDIAPQFYDALSAVFSCIPRQLYCTWHVDKAWQEQLRSKIKDFELESQVYTQLRIVLEQTEERNFNSYLSLLCERLHNSSATKEFAEYFDVHWVPYASRWGYYFRCGLGINTNMFCEAFHRVFKYNYLKGKQNRRVDKCLVNLMKYSRDKNFERIIKLTKGKATQRLKMIQERHQTSLRLSFGMITAVNDAEWHVNSEAVDRRYDVKLTGQACDNLSCGLRCVDCNVCIHTYTCTCTDFLLYCTICKHIHLVHRQRERSGTVGLSRDARNDGAELHQTDGNDELHDLVQMVQNESRATYEELKERAKELFLSIIGSIEESDGRHTEATRHLIKGGTALKNTFDSMKKVTSVAHIEPKIKANNKNIEQQRNFFSTTKRRRKGNIRFAKPTDDDRKKFETNEGFAVSIAKGSGIKNPGQQCNKTGNIKGMLTISVPFVNLCLCGPKKPLLLSLCV